MSMQGFPNGRAGMGLLLLRLAIGSSLVLLGASLTETTSRLPWQGRLLVVTGALLAAGFWTKAAGALGALGAGWQLATSPGTFAGVDGGLALLLMASGSSALVLLGPGALSCDARIFGRREIVIERRAPRRSEP
jgi:hypothetical protein